MVGIRGLSSHDQVLVVLKCRGQVFPISYIEGMRIAPPFAQGVRRLRSWLAPGRVVPGRRGREPRASRLAAGRCWLSTIDDAMR
jgi:hypothetical protein